MVHDPNLPVRGKGHMGTCDACLRDFPSTLLMPVGEGSLYVCPSCLKEARQVVRTDKHKGLRLVKPA